MGSHIWRHVCIVRIRMIVSLVPIPQDLFAHPYQRLAGEARVTSRTSNFTRRKVYETQTRGTLILLHRPILQICLVNIVVNNSWDGGSGKEVWNDASKKSHFPGPTYLEE